VLSTTTTITASCPMSHVPIFSPDASILIPVLLYDAFSFKLSLILH
jgi:hypothetical protein